MAVTAQLVFPLPQILFSLLICVTLGDMAPVAAGGVQKLTITKNYFHVPEFLWVAFYTDYLVKVNELEQRAEKSKLIRSECFSQTGNLP